LCYFIEENLIESCGKEGISRDDVGLVIDYLKKRGELFEPRR